MRLLPFMAAAACAAITAAPARLGLAQQTVQGFALSRFDPAPAGDALFAVSSPAAGGHLVPRAFLMFDYAHQPFHLKLTGRPDLIHIVAAQGFLRADASFALWDRLLVSADMPLSIVQSGEDPAIPNVDFHPPSSAAAGDLRLGLRGRIIGQYRDPFQIGAEAYLYAPTGSATAYAGDGAIRGAFHARFGGRMESKVGFIWNASPGVLLRASSYPHQFCFAAGAALSFAQDFIQVGPELYGSTEFGEAPLRVPGTEIRAGLQTHLEILFGAKLRVAKGLVFGAAAGTGPLDTIGSPGVRVVAMAGWAPQPDAAPEKKPVMKAGDKDGDGIGDDIDACPNEKGQPSSDPSKDGCPPGDRDADQVLDIEDACPTVAGVRSVDATKNGCPIDRDDDGFHDGIDACPDVQGAASPNPKRNGCPPDRDGDGVFDATDACPDKPGPASDEARWNGCPDDPDGDGIKRAADACPNEKGPPNTDPKENGCPKLVRMTGDEIVLKSQVQFTVYGKHRSETIEPISGDLLTEVRDVIHQHPEILLIEVQGHTDDSGDEAFNQQLSQDRAEMVRQWLIDAGISKDKLVAKGYGYTKPLADNRIRQGRQANRRVQFVIIKRK